MFWKKELKCNMYLKGICCRDYLTFKTKAPFNISIFHLDNQCNVYDTLTLCVYFQKFLCLCVVFKL